MSYYKKAKVLQYFFAIPDREDQKSHCLYAGILKEYGAMDVTGKWRPRLHKPLLVLEG